MHFLPGHRPPKQIPALHLLLKVSPCPFHLRRGYDYTQQGVIYISLICLFPQSLKMAQMVVIPNQHKHFLSKFNRHSESVLRAKRKGNHVL